MVNVSVAALVVRVIPLPASIVKVSLALSATILSCPATVIVLNVLVTLVPVIVIASVAALVVNVIPVPATRR
jgi:hypothetical protein